MSFVLVPTATGTLCEGMHPHIARAGSTTQVFFSNVISLLPVVPLMARVTCKQMVRAGILESFRIELVVSRSFS